MGALEKAADETLKKDKMDEDKPDPGKVKDVKKDTEVKDGGGNKKKDEDGGGKKKKDEKEEDLSEEDAALKEKLELMVERLQDKEAGVQKLALEQLRNEIRDATSSMTSVPKPLKFLRPHCDTLKGYYESFKPSENKTLLADILSVLAMTMSMEGSRESLHYRLKGHIENVGSWGHEYIRTLAGEIGQEYQQRQVEEKPVEDLMGLVRQIIPFHVQHNAEPEAVDLLMEVESLELLMEHVGPTNFRRTCLYLLSFASYVPEPDDSMVLRTAFKIFKKVKNYDDALRTALRLNSSELVTEAFAACEDPLEKKQLAYILAREGFALDLESDISLAGDDERDTLQEIISNSKLSEGYLTLARDLDVMEAKTPDDIYKAHLIDSRTPSSANVDSARQNLAATFVNGLVNAGFGTDKLMTGTGEEASSSSAPGGSGSWLFKNKEHGKTSAAASVGLIHLWDVDGGLPQIDKYLYSNDNYVLAGGSLAIGIVSSGIRHESDPAFALLSESVNKEDPAVRIGAIMGLGLAYAGVQKEEVLELLTPVVLDSLVGVDVAAFAALSLGLVYVGTCNDDVAMAILQALMERGEAELAEPLVRYFLLALGLLFLGQGEAVDATIEVVKTLNEKVSMHAQIILDSCAYAGTGNVLKVQRLLSICGDHLEEDKTPGGVAHQGAAVLGIALVAMAEELGQDMAIRSLEHLLQYGEPGIRRAVPLALGILSISNPRMTVMDTLSRLSHDVDQEVAMGAIVAMGLIGGGTNNARIAGMLRNLSSYYYKEPNLLFTVRIAQGLVHLGKGLLTLNPFHADRGLLHQVGLAGILALLHSCMDFKNIILAKYHYALYYVVPALQPRMLLTVDENLKPLPVSVRVGQAVDVVGQAGRPKTITGFQTHTTPVLLATGDRAELATEKYIPLTSILEGFVILKPNPDYVEDHLDK